MPRYTPPLRDMRYLLHEVLGAVDKLKALPRHADLDADTVDAVLEEAGRFAAEVVQPLNQVGDKEGCTLDPNSHEVRTPTGFKAAYAKFIEGGWPALACEPAFGGQGWVDYTVFPAGFDASSYSIGTQVFTQLKAVVITLLWSGIGSAILYFIIDKTMGLRPSVEEELQGLDLSSHGERAWEFD